MSTPAQTALAPWFGAKRTMSAAIVRQLGPHRSYWEPFCGSLAVLFNKPPAMMETVNDLHQDLVNLARVVQDPQLAPQLYDRCRRTLFCEALFHDSRAALQSARAEELELAPAAAKVERAYHYFVVSWMGPGGLAGTPTSSQGFAKRFSSKGGPPGVRFAGAADSIPWWHERLRPVGILCGDGVGLCEKVEDRKGTTIYADPPYLEKGAAYLHDFSRGDRSGAASLFDGAEDDHERLAKALRRFRHTRCVVSYYDHPDLAALYPGWAKVRVRATKNVANPGADAEGRVEAPEVLLVNGDPYPEPEEK
jgi:DNA adenine methylase